MIRKWCARGWKRVDPALYDPEKCKKVCEKSLHLLIQQSIQGFEDDFGDPGDDFSPLFAKPPEMIISPDHQLLAAFELSMQEYHHSFLKTSSRTIIHEVLKILANESELILGVVRCHSSLLCMCLLCAKHCARGGGQGKEWNTAPVFKGLMGSRRRVGEENEVSKE